MKRTEIASVALSVASLLITIAIAWATFGREDDKALAKLAERISFIEGKLGIQ